MNTWRTIVLSLIAGACLAASFQPIAFWPAAFIGIALWCMALVHGGPLRAIGSGFTVGLAFFAPHLWWVWAGSGTPLAWLALTFVEAAYLGVLGLVWHGILTWARLGSHPYLQSAALATTWAAMEQLRATWPLGGMPWGQLAFGQIEGTLVHLAPWGSAPLVSGMVVAISALALWALRETSAGTSLRLVAASTAIIALFVPWFFPVGGEGTTSVKIAWAQGIVPAKSEEVEGSRALVVTENLADEVERLRGESFDILALPESASDRDIRVDDASRALVARMEEVAGEAPILLGTQEYVGDFRYNDYVLLSDGEVQARYSKQHPVPFGEYLPFRNLATRITSAASQVSIDMLPGTGPALLEVPTNQGSVLVGVPICFEIADGSIVAEAVRAGTQVLIVPTNTASFAHTAQSAQQFDITRFRAIEYGRTAVAVSTVGVSGVIEPNGAIAAKSGTWTSESGVARVGLRSSITFAARNYEQILALTFALGALCAVLSVGHTFFSSRKGRNR